MTTPLPSLAELGHDLLRVSKFRVALSLALPFLWCAAYFVFAAWGSWPAAVAALIALSFVTYGSVSHDLVHRTLGLPRRVNDVLLGLIELLALRSGQAYRLAHLHHHACYPRDDDVEALAAGKSLVRTLAEGIIFVPRIWIWAVCHARQRRGWIIAEGLICLLGAALGLLGAGGVMLQMYVVLMVMGSWVIPLATSYIPHDPAAPDDLHQTRVFRGVVASTLALDHLYHLEHHCYPLVPHHRWRELARRLDPHLMRAGVQPIRILF